VLHAIAHGNRREKPEQPDLHHRYLISVWAGGAYGLAVDSAHIYWANGAGYIGRADLNGLT
jgi:hypothetical protein